jgi:hypothetical protein
MRKYYYFSRLTFLPVARFNPVGRCGRFISALDESPRVAGGEPADSELTGNKQNLQASSKKTESRRVWQGLPTA